jgi:hypothetical protein
MFGLVSKKRLEVLEAKLAIRAEYSAYLEKAHAEHVQSLKDQIQDLKKLVYSPTSATTISPVALEQDAVLSQREEVIRLSPEEIEKMQEIEAEASRILSGMY